MLSGLNLCTDFRRIQYILKTPQRPTCLDIILKLYANQSLSYGVGPSSFIMPRPSLPAKEKALIDFSQSPSQYLQRYEEIHSVKFPFRQFGPPKVGVNHCQKILKKKRNSFLDLKCSWQRKTIFVLTLSDITAQLSIHRKS